MAPIAPLKTRATYNDLCDVPENMVAEIVDGELYATPRPALRHAHSASVLGATLGGPFHLGRNGPGGWVLLDEPELHFGGDVLVPDIAGWRRERLPVLPDAAWLSLAPDWICEVLSPATEAVDRTRKLRIYAREGVWFAWLIDPRQRSLEMLERSATGWTLVATFEGDVEASIQPFAAIALDLGALWAET